MNNQTQDSADGRSGSRREASPPDAFEPFDPTNIDPSVAERSSRWAVQQAQEFADQISVSGPGYKTRRRY